MRSDWTKQGNNEKTQEKRKKNNNNNNNNNNIEYTSTEESQDVKRSKEMQTSFSCIQQTYISTIHGRLSALIHKSYLWLIFFLLFFCFIRFFFSRCIAALKNYFITFIFRRRRLLLWFGCSVAKIYGVDWWIGYVCNMLHVSTARNNVLYDSWIVGWCIFSIVFFCRWIKHSLLFCLCSWRGMFFSFRVSIFFFDEPHWNFILLLVHSAYTAKYAYCIAFYTISNWHKYSEKRVHSITKH